MNSHWKDWCWSWSSNSLATWCEELTHLKRPWCWERLMTEDEMVGWHHQLDGHEFEQAPGVGDGQGRLACSSPWGCKESDTTEWLNWTGGERMTQEGGDKGIQISDLLCCTAETNNIVKQLYPNLKNNIWFQSKIVTIIKKTSWPLNDVCQYSIWCKVERVTLR